MEKMRQQECKSEAICSKLVDDELDLTLTLGLPNHVRGKNVSNITQPHQKSTQLICSQQAMQKLNFSHDQVMKSCTMVVSESDHNKENVIFSGSSNKQMSWPLMSNQSIMMNSRGLVQIPKAIIKEAPAHSNIMMISTSCNYNMNSTCNRIAYPPKNQMNNHCYIILDPSKKRTRSSSSSSSTFSSSSSKKRKSHTKTKLQSASSGSRRGKSNTEFTDHDREVPGVVKDPNKRCTNYNCGVRFSPMWRRGPLGPKSLCNACGIRFRKQEQKRMEEGSDISCTSTADTYRSMQCNLKLISCSLKPQSFNFQ